MANLDLIKTLNINYGKQSVIAKSKDIVNLNEAFDLNKLGKGLDNAIANLGPKYLQYFEFGLPADVAIMFIDVCNFSTRFGGLDGEEIGEYFDEYYDIVIPTIYKYGGEVEKIIGDGIIAIFGAPFVDVEVTSCIKNAIVGVMEIIKQTIDTDYSSKVALHSGEIHYFKNKTGLYNEFTVIGKPLTELFRLESISEDNCINYYHGTPIYDYLQARTLPTTASAARRSQVPWGEWSKPIIGLKGVDYTKMSYIAYSPPK